MPTLHAMVGYHYTIEFPEDISPEQAVDMAYDQTAFRDPPVLRTYISNDAPSVKWTDAREEVRMILPRVESQQANRIEPDATNAVSGLLHLPLSRDEWWEAMNLLSQDIWPNPISSERTTLVSVVGQASPEHAMELRILLRDLVDAIQYRESVYGTEQEANGKTVYSEALSEAKKYLAAT
jgi:hypothetical protein